MKRADTWPCFQVLDRGHEVVYVRNYEAGEIIDHLEEWSKNNGAPFDLLPLIKALDKQLHLSEARRAPYAVVLVIEPPTSHHTVEAPSDSGEKGRT